MLEKEQHLLKATSLLIIEPLDISGSEAYQAIKTLRARLGLGQVVHLKQALIKDNYRQVFH